MKHMMHILLVILVCFSQLHCAKDKAYEKDMIIKNKQNTGTVQVTPPNCAKELDILINDSIADMWQQFIRNYQGGDDCQQLDVIENGEHEIEIIDDFLHVYIGSAVNDVFELVWDGTFYEVGGVNFVKLFFNETFVSAWADSKKGIYCFNLSKLKSERKNNFKINIELIAECGHYTKNIIYEP